MYETIVAHGYTITIDHEPPIWSAEITFASDGRKMHAISLCQSSCRTDAFALAAQNVTQADLNANLSYIPSNRMPSLYPDNGVTLQDVN